jgi:quercetin dioxygenase-like cupin family protein
MPGGVRTEVHLIARDTGGAFCLFLDEPPYGWSLPAHRHANEAETIHIVDGEFEMTIDGASQRLVAGSTIHIPKGVFHSGANVGDAAGRRLVVFSPAGMERFIGQVGSQSPDEGLDQAAVLREAIRHGWEFPRS